MNTIFVNECAADGCYKKNLGDGKQMCAVHQEMYETGEPFKGFYGKTVLKEEFQGKSEAVISECGKYRYSLTRIWNKSKPAVMFVMLNPSTADGIQDDPTIRRCIGFAKSWGYGGIYVCNLFAYRATNPKELLDVDNPFGDQNIWYTKGLADKVNVIVCAWGNNNILRKILKNKKPFELLHFSISKLHFLELSKTDTPKHPLYLKSNLTPSPFNSGVSYNQWKQG